MTQPLTHGAGQCPHCLRPTGNVKKHAAACADRTVPAAPAPNSYVEEVRAMAERAEMHRTEASDAYAIRAAAHAAHQDVLRGPQRFQRGVTDLDVARLMLTLERGTHLMLTASGRWIAPQGSPVRGKDTSAIVEEAIRTGLVRHYWPAGHPDPCLIPAKVHLDIGERMSACLFTGEDMGPMRSRLVRRLDLVDCLDCEHVVATGKTRGL